MKHQEEQVVYRITVIQHIKWLRNRKYVKVMMNHHQPMELTAHIQPTVQLKKIWTTRKITPVM